MPIENIASQCQVDTKVDMVGFMKDVFIVVDQICKQVRNTGMDEPRMGGGEARASDTNWS